jgi:hypothetical protein
VGEREIARLTQLGYSGEVRGEGEEWLPPLPSLSEAPPETQGAGASHG